MKARRVGLSYQGRLFYDGDSKRHPGWHLQHYVDGRIHTKALWILSPHEVLAAVSAAAEFLGCLPAQIQLEGQEWPLPRAGKS